MGRIKEKPQILFKNSNNTFNTYSKTCSAFSEAVTKSIIMQLKNKIKNNNYYDYGGTIKRDLSVETDICILRRYVKENKSKIQNKQSSCARFKYSINNTDKEVIEKSKADSSACGDSQDKIGNAHLKVDLTTLVVDNLKTLLNDWIRKYLLENDKTKQKIATVLDSLLHKVELEHSSSGTYTVDVEVINETQTTNSLTSKSKKGKLSIKSRRKLSSQTVPLTGQRVKLISTLSVPKILSSNNKSRYNRTFINYHKSSVNKLLSTSSSCNILEIKTESLTKRCATYQNLRWEKISDQKQFSFVQEPTPPDSSIKFLINNEDIDLNKETKQKENISQLEIERVHGSKKDFDKSPSAKMKFKDQCKQHKNNIIKRQTTHPTFHSSKGKKTFLYQSKRMSQKTRRNKVLKHIKDVFTYFENCECINDLKFDIHINILSDNNSNKPHNNYSPDNAYDNSKIKNNTKLICNNNPVNIHTKTIHSGIRSSDISRSSKYESKIISLLDGAISHNRYLLSQKDTAVLPHNKDQQTDTSGTEIFQDISEIKDIIKNLVNVAEHMAKQQSNNKLNRNTATEIITPHRSTSKVLKNSIAIQCVTTETKNVNTSGLKFDNESQNKEIGEFNFNPRLIKKSTSYRIIESESFLQIHDLTSKPKKIIEKTADDLLQTESFPKSQSLLDVPVINHNRKLLAFYCDKCVKSKQCVYNSCNHNVPYANMYSTCGCENHYDNFRQLKVEHCPNINYSEVERNRVQCSAGNCCAMPGKTCIDAEADAENSDSFTEVDGRSDKKFIVTKRSVGFKEGCFYCFLLWIPIIIIMWLFYVFILKVYLESKESSTKSPQILISKNNSSMYAISMSDLGF
ncbi:putative uncharacterized protein DDB_G0277255 [Pieris brassicae]|uniref:putative uncharacterized protein DDB_G0277255 n=1 Tax=Pieris brassicae TaxID=7116 RepID=UPI001E65EB9E|nr:putative uncharacterized protein DDB_G0277255 [Pieris brassicae]